MELGATKAEALRDSGKLDKVPCSVTGSTAPELVEWLVPVKWQSFCEEDYKRLRLQVKTDATEEDKAAIEQMATQSADANGSVDVSGVPVKVEGMKAIDQIKKHVSEFKEKSIEVLRRCQDMVVQAKKAENNAPQCADKFAKMLLADIVPHTKKLSKVCGILEKLASGDDVDDAGSLPSLRR